MKKFIAILLAATISLALTSCGSVTPDSNDNQTASKNTTSKNNANENTSNKKEYEAVEITIDNWSEYLEFTSEYSVYYKESAFEDVEKEINGVSQDFYFGVKDEFFSLLDTEKSTLTVQISTDFGTQKGTFSDDYSSFEPNGEFEIYQPMTMESSEFQVTEHGSFAWHISSAAASSKSELKMGELFKWLKNQQVLNITGTLYISK